MSNRRTVFEHVIEPAKGTLSKEHAQYVLALKFPKSIRDRYLKLSRKAQEGALTESESAELDDYLAANSLLVILKSKARVSLGRRNSAA
jgi:hypothetical protein